MKFTKMQALGNDFMVINAVTQPLKLNAAHIVQLADRHTGIGFDQCLVVESSRDPKVDFFYRIFNADGQEVGQCANGARCLARFIQQQGLSPKTHLRIATKTTTMDLELLANGLVCLCLTAPKFEPSALPMTLPQQASYQLMLQNEEPFHFHAVSVGNPHAVCVVKNIDEVDVQGIGKAVSEHAIFPEQANVGFMQVLDSEHLRLRVYERGCGETQACGSGAVAAGIVARLYYQTNERMQVALPGGTLEVYWPALQGPVFLTGAAVFVYEGEISDK